MSKLFFWLRMLMPLWSTFALLYKVDHSIELECLFSLCSLTCNSYVSLHFCLEKKASIFLVFFASENLGFDCSFANYGTFFLINKVTSANLYAWRHCWSSHFHKGESAEYRMLGSSVILIITRACSENSAQEWISFGIPQVMGAIESLGCNWWSNMYQITRTWHSIAKIYD